MLSTNRQTHRRIFLEAWRKASNAEPLEPLEAQIAEVIRQHPEYQPLLAKGEEALDQDFHIDPGQPNPFFHMGLHLAVLEQLSIDQPKGIRALYQKLRAASPDAHAVEHGIMDCLAQSLWAAQQGPQGFDQNSYIDCIERAAKR